MNYSKKLTLSAGMAAILLSAFALPTAAFAQSDSMMEKGDGAMMKNEGKMMEKSGHASKALRGKISSVQLESGQSRWIQSGIWVLRASEDSASFIARINMVGADGTSAHTHTISRFAAEDIANEGDNYTITGTATVTTSGEQAKDVPLTISVMNRELVSLEIDPAALDGHFGQGVIYGIVSQSKSASMAKDGAMMEKGDNAMMEQKLARTNVPVTLPLTRGFVNGSEVFYISTEASDKGLADHLTNVTGSRVAYSPALAAAPPGSLANIYAFSNGIAGPGPLGFQPNVADSQPGDAKYSPLWRINTVEWQTGKAPRELRSEQEVLDASLAGKVKITFTDMVVNCPFVQWEGGSLQVRQDKELADDTAYGGGQVLSIDTARMQVTFVGHRGFAPDGSTIYYIATDASVKEVADALGVVHAARTGSALATGAASDLWVFTNGIKGTGPMGFQASVAGSDVSDDAYSPLWRILATTWSDAGKARFLTTSSQISAAGESGMLSIEIAGAVVNCPFVEA
ncbi:MAG: DUF7482 domain-containing protein [Nitrososphaera sp.]|uniref:DUF7482 domain-containing protein n=1 Tax=Nitrososphaera sp. TaxID=1971748 RepID=UPI003D6FCBAC